MICAECGKPCKIPKYYLHVCPVCNGNGLVPNGFYNQTSGNWYSTDITPDTCKSCNGTGIITLENNNSQYVSKNH